jgi:hypothetical protein
MGASSDQIDQQIRETRGELNQRLEVLELRAASGARRYGRVAAGVAVGILAVAVGVIAYRRHRRQTAVKQLHDMLFESVRDLPNDRASRLKRRLPIKVVVTDRAHEEATPSLWAGIAGKVAPAVAGSAAGAIMSRVMPGSPKTSAKTAATIE